MKQRIRPKAGQESVWDYPRPPRCEAVEERLRVVHQGTTLADTRRARRILETSHPPTYYIPPEDVRMDLLTPSARAGSMCEWKGKATYWDLKDSGDEGAALAWSYPSPSQAYRSIKDHLAFYPSKVDACYVGEERVQAQAGDFYGGWITSKIVGPFKGGPGTWGW